MTLMTRRTGQRRSRRISGIIVTTTTATMMIGNEVEEEEQGVSKARIEGGLKDTDAHGPFVEIGDTLSFVIKYCNPANCYTRMN